MLNWNDAFSKDAYEFEFKDVDTEVTPEFARNLRLKLKLSQTMFAKVLGISNKTIEKWEQGGNPIKGTASRVLYLLNKHEYLLDDLYLSKREDEEFFYDKRFIVNTIKKQKNAKIKQIEDTYQPSCSGFNESLFIKTTEIKECIN